MNRKIQDYTRNIFTCTEKTRKNTYKQDTYKTYISPKTFTTHHMPKEIIQGAKVFVSVVLEFKGTVRNHMIAVEGQHILYC